MTCKENLQILLVFYEIHTHWLLARQWADPMGGGLADLLADALPC